jgi:hypothetical protein
MGTPGDLINFSQSMAILEPHERIKKLASFGNIVEIDTNIPIIRYVKKLWNFLFLRSAIL